MLSVWYILILNIYVLYFTRCAILKNINLRNEGLRIVGGRDALPGEYPYVLRIEWEKIKKKSTVNRMICTCVCIKPIWSLTAAHCIIAMKTLTDRGVKQFYLRYNPSLSEVAYVKVLSMAMNPNFHKSSRRLHLLYNDIGILKSEKIALSTYARVSPVDYSTLYGFKVSAVGYGLLFDDNDTLKDTLSLNKTLQVVDAMIIKCTDKNYRISPSYCLAGTCKKWTPLSNGDSGGPVIHSSGIVGVNSASHFGIYKSWGFIKGNNIKPVTGFITPVSPFVDWIRNVIKENM